MHFTEVAVQNVRGFSPAGRFALKPGYLVLKPPAPTEPSALAGLTLALLYADGRGGEASFNAPGQRGKAALTFVGQDGVTYRLLRELGGSGTLHRINPTTQQPELVTQDSAEMNQYLRGQAGLPPRTTFEQVCCLQATQLPTRRPRLKAAGGKAAEVKAPSLSGGLGSVQSVAPAGDVRAAEARLKELEQELAVAREVEQIQFQADGLSSQSFELDSKLKSTEGLQAKLREAEAAWAAAPSAESLGLPPDILQRVERFPKAQARRDDALARLQAERDAAAERAASVATVEPLTQNHFFLAALGVGILFFLLGIFLSGPAKYVALLDIPAFGVAAVFALRYVEDLQRASRVDRKDEMFAAREKKIQDEYESETALIRAAMKTLDVGSHEDIPAVFQRKVDLKARVDELRMQLQAAQEDPDFQAAAGQQQALRQQLEALNAELQEKGAFARDLREVEREMTRLRESIALAKAPPPAAPAAAAPGVPASAGELLEDPTPLVLNQASDVLATNVPAVAGMMRERCVQYLAALTDRRYANVEWDKDGRAVFVAAAGNRIPAGELPPKDLDLYYLGLRMAVVEKLSARVKLPFMVEDALGAVEEAKLQLLGRMLKHLGTLTQVVQVTAHPGFVQMSDGTVNL
jgi:hypothetical protein